MKIVLDTNCLLVSLPEKSKYHWLYKAIEGGTVVLAFTNEILMEYSEILGSYYTPIISENIVLQLLNLKKSQLVTVYFRWNLISVDPDDNKFVDCAIASNANFIVTNDKHFKELLNISFPKVNTVTIQEFEKLLK